MTKKKKIIYLALPYSHEDEAVRVERYEWSIDAAAFLQDAGHIVYSPITQNHPIAVKHGLPTGWDYWESYDRAFLECCESIYVLTLDGWEESTGVTAEIKIAREMGIPVRTLFPDEVRGPS